jgi:hypothetical protein
MLQQRIAIIMENLLFQLSQEGRGFYQLKHLNVDKSK